MKIKILFSYLLILFLSFITQEAQASHFVGAELTYRCIDNVTNTYEITFSYYRDCNGSSAPTSINPVFSSTGGCSLASPTLAVQNIQGVDVSQLCNPSMSSCLGGPEQGTKQYTYTGNVVLSPSCGIWTISYGTCCRSASITNLQNPASQGAYVETTIDVNAAPCNSSAQFTNVPLMYTCAGTPTFYNHGAFDPDGDSLLFTLVAAQDNPPSPIPYVTGISATSPLALATGTVFDLDSITGQMTFTPNAGQAQLAVITVRVDEIRNGAVIGSTIREMQIVVLNSCSNSIPHLDSVVIVKNGMTQVMNGTIFEGCPGQALNFKIHLSDLDGDAISYNSFASSILQVFPNAVVTSSYPTAPTNDVLVLDVQIPNIQNRAFSFSFADNACPVPGTNNLGFFIQSNPNNCPLISGKVAIDGNANCIVDTLESPYNKVFVIAQKGNFTTFTIPDNNGYYELPVDTGSYNISISAMHPYWTSCIGNMTTNLLTYSDNDTIDIPMDVTVQCPLMYVHIGAPQLISCQSNYYVINYCNNGTDLAIGAYIEVELDSLFTVDSTTIPISAQNGNLYTFNLGNLGVNICGDFRIYGQLDSSCNIANFNRTFCAIATAYPDTVCISNPLWSGADLVAEAQCNSDSVALRIKNIGINAMSASQVLLIIKDNYAIHSEPFTLGSGGTTNWFNYYADGATYRIETDQISNHPWQNQIAAVVVGCLDSASTNPISTGFVNIFSLNDAAPFVSIDCQEARNSWDPNDKRAFPEGYAAQHFIEDNTDLEYRVRFQNTGTAPALNVVIRDTLSPYLDVMTLQMGAYSHSYSWQIIDNAVLEFTFANINLPDSVSNEPASHGFVDYKIKQKANNAVGTVIYNSAAIYFDMNPPVITNQTFHTIGDNFIQIISSTQDVENTARASKVKVYPNPFSNQATFEIEGEENYENIQLSVFDVTGKLVRQIDANNNRQIQLERGNLVQGIYLYRLEADGALLDSGKMIVK